MIGETGFRLGLLAGADASTALERWERFAVPRVVAAQLA
jgi:hypothetical protein